MSDTCQKLLGKFKTKILRHHENSDAAWECTSNSGTCKQILDTFFGVLLEKETLTLPQLDKTLCRESANCLARPTPYWQCPDSNFNYTLYSQLASIV